MGWFFGCFGGSSKKDRKHQTPVAPPPKQQKPCSTPIGVPLALSSAIPIKTFPVRDVPNTEDLYTVRQFSSSAPVRQVHGAYLYGAAGVQLPEREEKPGPWHQLDDLEEELNDLRKQIQRDSHDAEKTREEVHSLKSCGSAQYVDHQHSSVQEGRWLSWLAPGGRSLAKIPPEKTFQFEGLNVALCEPTPVKEHHGALLGIQNPLQSKNLRQSTKQHKMHANVQDNHFKATKESDIDDSPLSPGRFPQRDQPLKGLNHFSAGDMSGTPLERPCDKPNQGSWSLCGTDSNLQTDAFENDNALMKKRRLAVNPSAFQTPLLLKQEAEDNICSEQYHNFFSQKRLKVTASREQVEGKTKSPLLEADPVPMHFFRCDSLSPIIESGTLNEESESSDSESNAQGLFDQQQSSYNSVSQKTSQSTSVKLSPASQAKSVTFVTIDDEGYTTDELSYSHATKYSEENYTNSTCINDENEDGLETASYSPSTDSEETISDLSPKCCYSPPISPNHEQSTAYRSLNRSGSTFERQTAWDTSTQHLSAKGGSKKQYVSRYGSEEDERSDDETELYTDAMSHVSTEYNEREYQKWYNRTDAIDTPPKQSDWISTPVINIQGKHKSRIRSKPASSVLTPVENVSQWKQLKERDEKQIVDGKAGSDGSRKYISSRIENNCGTGTDSLKAGVGDKILPWNPPRINNGQFTSQDNGPVSVNTSLSHSAAALRPEAVLVSVNASLSHWGVKSRADTKTADGRSEPESETVRVDMSLSHWLKPSFKHNGAQISIGASSDTSSSGEGGVESPAPPPDNQVSHLVRKTERRQPAASERPILGALGGENCGNAKARSPWDGKGTPNATVKYMEDQRVKWHSTPFEQRLEKALDKQGILLQKKLFVATPAAS
ncbi:hypothetical protein L7F22_037472 [Adiantum nelumboides]|nr:hypothetical protein [Adiantum nelumboides]